MPLRLIYGKGGVVMAVQNLDGTPASGINYQPDRVRNHLRYFNGFSDYIGDAHGYKRQTYQPSYRLTRAYFWQDNPYNYPRFEQWFTLVGPNFDSTYLIGYLPRTKLPFGYLDQKGFEPLTAVPEPFSADTQLGYSDQGSKCLWSPTGARYVFLGERKIVDLPLPAPGPIYGMGSGWANKGNASVNIIGLTLGSGIAVYNNNAALVTLVPFCHDTSQWGAVSLTINADLDRFYVRYDPSEFIPKEVRATMPSYLDEMDIHGQVVHDYTLPPLPPDRPNPPTWPEYLADHLQSPAFFFGNIFYKKMGALLGSARMQKDLDDEFKPKDDIRQIILWVTILPPVLAVVTLAWARRACFAWRRAWAWAGFVLAFGLPGFLMFRLAADWPRFVPCPTCSKPRPTEASQCPHCDAGWPAPAATGIEIFDQAQPALETAAAGQSQGE